MKDYTSKTAKSIKRTISSTSPTENKDQKKAKYSSNKLSTSSTSNMGKDKEDSALKNEEPDRKLEGALGPHVQQIKLLKESFDDQYSHLDDKYTRLESAITSQKNEMSSELGKLHESIAKQRKELTATVEKKMEASNEKMEQVLRENISLKKSNSVLQEHLSKIESTQLDNNVMLTRIQVYGPYSCFFGCACHWVLSYIVAFNCVGKYCESIPWNHTGPYILSL